MLHFSGVNINFLYKQLLKKALLLRHTYTIELGLL